MALLYCKDDLVIAWHEDSQDIDPSLYGNNIYIVPVATMDGLERVGPPPPGRNEAMRIRKAPQPTKELLIAYTKNLRARLVRNIYNGHSNADPSLVFSDEATALAAVNSGTAVTWSDVDKLFK